MKKICFVLTTDIAVKAFLLNHLHALTRQYEVSVIVGTDHPSFLAELGIPARVIPMPIARKIHPLNDIKSLFELVWHFRKNQFDAVHSVTPKAGLLAMLAGLLSGVPVRTHTFTGQVWANKRGLPRLLLKCMDKCLSTFSTHVIVDSPSQRDFLCKERVISKQKALVFGIGSIAGVDSQKFKPDSIARQQVRSALNFTEETFLFLFLGRLNPDKGVLELAQAYIRANLPNSGLLFVGPDEQYMQKKISQLPDFLRSNIRFIDYTNTPEQFMTAADVLCLPSYREGFGTVIIEAASCGIPAIASRIYGITDAVTENQTGLLHVAGDIDDICLKMQQIYADKPLYQSLANAAQQRAIQHFDSQVITQAWCDFYGKVLA